MKHSDFRGDISRIKDLFPDGYEAGFPIIKELIQNANDAGATTLIIGLINETVNFKHPLIKESPAMYILNNGKFTYDNACAINEASSSDKKSEYTIGKFGLGLKSLFNYCEAFFYLCNEVKRTKNIKYNEYYLKKINMITPWEITEKYFIEENPYQEWWDFCENNQISEHDYNLAKKILSTEINKNNMKDWFLLWIPLRTEKLIVEDNYIVDRYWNRDSDALQNTLFNKANYQKISQILPMMNSLTKIILKNTNNQEIIIRKIEGNPLSLKQIKKNYEKKHFEIQKDYKVINVSSNSDNYNTNALLLHRPIENDFINLFIKKRQNNKNEKNIIPHCGILFTETETKNKLKLDFHHSCFLPLSKDDKQDSSKFNIFLHGTFYMDSRRTGIHFEKSDNMNQNRKQEIEWNQIIKTNATHLLIQTLSEFINIRNVSSEEKKIITESLNKFIKDNELKKDEVCYKYYWLERALYSNNEWIKIENNINYYFINKDYENFINLIPNFENTLKENIFISSTSNIISNRSISNWESGFFDKFWEVSFSDLITNENFRNFWICETKERIKYLDKNESLILWDKYINVIKQNLLNLLWNEIIEKYVEQIKNLIEPVKNLIYTINLENKESFIEINKLLKDTLLLPQPSYSTDLKISNDDAKLVLKWISVNKPNKFHKLTCDVLMKSSYYEIKNEIRDFKIFEVKKNNESTVFFSIDDIENHLVVNENTENIVISSYTSAFINLSIYKISTFSGKDYDLKKYFPKIAKLTEESILSHFNNKKFHEFNSLENRFNLFKLLINKFQNNYKSLIRKLFIGSDNDSNETLYIFRTDDFWFKISKIILESRKQDYRIICSNEINFNQELQEKLGIYILQEKIPTEILKSQSSNINLSFLYDTQREAIYRKVDENKKLLSLPIYKTVNGNTISLSDNLENVFMLSKETEPDDIPKENISLLPYNKYLALINEIKHINNISLIKIYLKSQKPENYTLNILNQLNKLNHNEIDEELRELITTIAWIPSKNGENYSIFNILFHRYSKDFNEIINEYYESTGKKCDFISASSLKDDFIKHIGSKKISEFNLWIDDELIFNRIGNLLRQIPKYNIGKLEDENIDLELFKIAFYKTTDIQIIEYITKWQNHIKPNILEKNILAAIITKTPPLEIQIKICNGLLESARKTEDFNNKKKILVLHQKLVKSYLLNSEGLELLNNIKLLNMNNKWCKAKTLCLQNDIIPNNYKLNDNYNSILCNIPIINKPSPIEDFSDKEEKYYTDKDILKLFKDIANSNDVTRNLVGIFLSFLGDGNDIWRKWAQDFFLEDGLTVNGIRNLVKSEWKSQQHYKDIDKHFEKLSVSFKMIDFPTNCIVHTIIGNTISIKSESVLIAPKYNESYPSYKFGIFKIDINNVKDLNEILKQALDHLILKIHNFKAKDSAIDEKLWNVYSKSSQLSIKITQQMLIHDLISIFRRLRLGKKNNKIKEILNKKQILEHKKAADLVRGDSKNYFNEEKEITEAIINVIKLPEIQKQLLIGVRKELKNFQYTKDSVIFELFQNADDAYLEKETLDLKTKDFIFKVFTDESFLCILHNGRNINQHKGNRHNEEEHWGFSNDLQKMLTLNYSDKEINNVTGKFGLGFKSIFLICDNPSVFSGDLSFEILGGVYPSEIRDERIKKRMREKLNNSFNSTLIYLPVTTEINLPNLLSKFILQAPFLPIFSKKIEKVIVESKEFSWRRTKIKDIDNLFYSKYKQSGLLVFVGDNWKLVFRYTEKGFVELEEINPIWVTVPTDSETKYKFAINADFNIDVGRRQLASEGNETKFSKIAFQFHNIVLDLIIKEKIPMGIEKYDFWESLFIQLTNADNSDLLSSIFWEDGKTNYYNLLNSKSILPNDLDNDYKALICLKNAKYILANELNKSDYLDILNECNLPIESCISENVSSRLNSQICLELEIIDVSNFKSKLNENLSIEQQEKIDKIEDQLKSKRITHNKDEQKQYEVLFSEKREQKKLEQEKEKSKFANQKQYTYSWFKCIVDASCNKEEKKQNNHSEKVRFTSCKISGNKLIFINPSRYLLQSYDTAETFSIAYNRSDKFIANKIEGVTFIETRAEVLLEKPLDKKTEIEFKNSQNFWLEFKNYIDVSQKIRDAFYNLDLDDDYSLKDNLPKNIKFIFGPPGTGKTYNIANKIISYQENKKILILTPTNKAADEIYIKIKEIENSIPWLSRFGNCTNEEIINDNQISNSSSTIKKQTTATIATSIRFSYDGYRDNDKFAETKWDYIIFDEASMIQIHHIAYIIQKAFIINPECFFIIAGDPKQIPPIYNFPKPKDKDMVEEIENIEKEMDGENIYSMVELSSFDSNIQNTKPYNYEIENLKIQYRSIKPIGQIFSDFAYNGLLNHAKDDKPISSFKFNKINFKEINIIEFPLAGGEIYRTRSIEASHTHPHIAILISEFLYKIETETESSLEIGIISPYKSQVKLMSKLIGKYNFKNLDIQVDTVHGFQGGQKDIIFCVFNPKVIYGAKPKISGDSRDHKTLLNRQYIINVAISRAKDYLFLFLPSKYYLSQNETKIMSGYENLYELHKLKRIVEKQAKYITVKKSSEIEKWCFNRKDYIYQNSNIIQHDLVNVYKESPKKYLVSYNEKAIDIQIKVDDE